MPRWIYNRPPEKCQHTEILFAQALNELLPDTWIVRWGYWYEDDKGTLREGDFLVLGPHGVPLSPWCAHSCEKEKGERLLLV